MYNPYDPLKVAHTLSQIQDPKQIQQFADAHKGDKDGAILVAMALNELNSRKAAAPTPPPPNGQVADKALGEAAQAAEQTYSGPQQFAAMTHDNNNPQLKAQAAQKKAGLAGGGAVLPENVGIGALPERSMAHMAEGGIIGYAGGGDTAEEMRRIVIEAARRNGIPEDLALRMAGAESGGRSGARNPRSTAGGLFQFLDSTWQGEGGDPSMKLDPYTNADIGTKYVGKNISSLRKNLGRDPSYAEVYAAHHFGPGVHPMLGMDPSKPIAEGLSSFESPERVQGILAANPHLKDKNIGQVMEYLGAKTIPGKTATTQDDLAAAAARARGVPSITQAAPVQFGAQSPEELARTRASATAARTARETGTKLPVGVQDYSSLEQTPSEVQVPFDMNRDIENGVPMEAPPARPSPYDAIRGHFDNPQDKEIADRLAAKRSLIENQQAQFAKFYEDEAARMAKNEAKSADSRRMNEAAAWANAAKSAVTGRQTNAQAFVNALTGGLGAYAAGEEKISAREDEAAARAAATRLAGMKTGLDLSLSAHDVGMENSKYLRERNDRLAGILAQHDLKEMSTSEQSKLFRELGGGNVATGMKLYADAMKSKSPYAEAQMFSYVKELQTEIGKMEASGYLPGPQKAILEQKREELRALQRDLAGMGGPNLAGASASAAPSKQNVYDFGSR